MKAIVAGATAPPDITNDIASSIVQFPSPCLTGITSSSPRRRVAVNGVSAEATSRVTSEQTNSSCLLARRAPVATDGIRPWTLLKAWEPPRKYPGLLLEQPIPDSLMTRRGSMPSSKNASMIRSEMAL